MVLAGCGRIRRKEGRYGGTYSPVLRIVLNELNTSPALYNGNDRSRYKSWHRIICRLYGFKPFKNLEHAKPRELGMSARLMLYAICIKDGVPLSCFEYNRLDNQWKIYGRRPNEVLVNWIYNLYKEKI
jgi:hypothetical protein